jgi:hypothetical protein
MSWVITLISLYIIKTLVFPLFHYYDLIIIYSDHLLEIDEWKGYVLLYSAGIILTILGTILFWKRKTLGWVLITLYIVSSVLGLLFILVIDMLRPWRQFYRIVDKFMMSDLPILYSLYVVFFVFSLYVLFKGKVKKVFKVNKIVVYLTVVAAIIFQVLAWYPLIIR